MTYADGADATGWVPGRYDSTRNEQRGLEEHPRDATLVESLSPQSFAAGVRARPVRGAIRIIRPIRFIRITHER